MLGTLEMDASPHLSGLDFARGLMRVGHRLTGNSTGYLLLERGARAVIVPLLDELPPVLLRFLLNGAGVSLPQLAAALQPTPLEVGSAHGVSRPPRSVGSGELALRAFEQRSPHAIEADQSVGVKA